MSFVHFPGARLQSVALIDPVVGEITYGTLQDLAEDWRCAFDRLVRTGAERLLIGVEIHPRAPSIAAYLGALRGGHPVILSAPGSLGPDSAISRIYRPNVVVTFAGDACEVERRTDDPAPLHQDLALLLSTSGTTGDPKLVRLSMASLASNAEAIEEYLGLGSDDTGITSLPLHYSYGMSVLHSHLQAGARLVLTPHSVTAEPFAELFAAHRVTNLACVPHQVDLLTASRFDFSRSPAFRFLTQAGGRLAPEKVRALAGRGRREGWDLIVMYGQTEAAPRMAYLPADATIDHSDTIGKAIPGGRLFVLGEDGTEVTEPGRAGQLAYEGPNVMMGYAETREDLGRGREQDRLLTGDIAERSEAGYFRLLGREKRFVKLYGLRLSLDAIEARLQSAGLSGHAVALGDRLAVMTTEPGQERRIVEELAAAYELPQGDIAVEQLETLPLQTNGKPDLRAIAAEARRALDRGAEPKGSLEAVFCEALRRSSIPRTESFESLGGDSMAFLHVQLAIEERLGYAPENWESLTLAEIEALAPRPRAPRMPVDGSVLLRLASISCMVLWHLNLWPLIGGRYALILLVGYSAARFQRRALSEGKLLKVARNFFLPILAVYFALILGYDILRGEVSPRAYLLVANYGDLRIGAPLLSPYWFISLYAQLAAFMIALAVWPRAREMMAERPFLFGISGVFLSLGLEVGLRLFAGLIAEPETARTFSMLTLGDRGLPRALPFLLLGWALAFAKTTETRLVVAAGVVAVLALSNITGPAYFALIIIGAMLMMFQLSLRLPTSLSQFLQSAAAATLYVYLFHTFVIHAVKHASPVHQLAGPWIAGALTLAVSFALGIVMSKAERRAVRLYRNLSLSGETFGRFSAARR